jgi:nitrous oxide reductase accessory protein NosL
MKHRVVLSLLVLVIIVISAGSVLSQDDIQRQRSCFNCGMDRKAYGYSRMLVRYKDADDVGVCSLHCAVIELASHRDRTVSSIQVADRNSHLLIDATKAFWMIGGSKRGVMTKRPKWAFATEAAARSFVADNGGLITNWAEAETAARDEIDRKAE